ncbi:hypothetical protein GCM10011487_19490 [Steroidobacter agaridevorans]|uniref:Phospholipase D-like domain-containing protein n=1 Tax=Steroidobacter agaridevorans TaxID=2695856 RepID=A0A829Y9F6_9GAMM|nr:hypothetical protein [Steroidobacter agaridevorans]GFE79949.1 hypothetical protein GCM10011487_19490 [Steroidobacter agaridevorans]
MADDSLYDALRRGGYEASLITTYNVYFPFYEEVVLRRLRASQCRHNVVLADARQCGASLSDTFAAPRRAGSDYTLVPMRSEAAFHPKVWLLVGKSRGLICLGSHNLTIAGFGYNREMTNWIEFDPRRDEAAVATARTVWGFIKTWLNDQQAFLPAPALEAVTSMKNHAPWLEGVSNVVADPTPLAQGTSTAPLFDQLIVHAPKSVKSIIVIGAFFDTKLQLLKALAKRWPEVRPMCGIEPATVSLPGKQLAKRQFDFRNASTLADRSGYLHAKAIFFEGRNGDHLLVSGSANPSAPAWLGGNEEAVLLRKGASARKAAEELGLLAIRECQPIAADQWASISESVAEQVAEEATRAAIVACETEIGFAAPLAAFPTIPKRCAAKVGESEPIELPIQLNKEDGMLVIPADRELRPGCTRLLFALAGGAVVEAIVHHTAMIEDLARSTQQAQFRAALQELGAESGDIAKLVSAVEKVIFDDASGAASEISDRSRRSSNQSAAQNEANLKPETLAVGMHETKKAKRHRRLLTGTDLGHLLDVLIHRLGVGLSRLDANVDSQGRTEEDRIGKDDDMEIPRNRVDDVKIASICQRKLRRLISRMKVQMDQQADPGPTVLVQLVAVLAITRELRKIEKHERWRRVHARLVDPADQRRLLDHVMVSFFGRGRDLYSRVVATLGTETFDEIARLKGLLIWLAWDCGVALDERFGISEHREAVEERIRNKAVLLELVQILSGDDISLEEARTSILSVANPGVHQAAAKWLVTCESWGRVVDEVLTRIRGDRIPPVQPSQIGSLAFATALARPRLRIVSSVSSGAVALFDFEQEIQYRPDRVSSVGLLSPEGLSAASPPSSS